MQDNVNTFWLIHFMENPYILPRSNKNNAFDYYDQPNHQREKEY